MLSSLRAPVPRPPKDEREEWEEDANAECVFILGDVGLLEGASSVTMFVDERTHGSGSFVSPFQDGAHSTALEHDDD